MTSFPRTVAMATFLAVALCTVASVRPTDARPPPPCVPTALRPDAALKALRAWDGYAPLKELPATVEVDPCRWAQDWDRVGVHLETNRSMSPGGFPYRATLHLRLGADAARPEDTPEIRARISKLAQDLPRHARAAETDPLAALWLRAYPPEVVKYEEGPEHPLTCVVFVASASPAARIATLRWCTKGGVAQYTVDRWSAVRGIGLERLEAAVKKLHPAKTLRFVTLRRNPRGTPPLWFAHGEVGSGSADGSVEQFRLSQAPAGDWLAE